ncbi:MAG: high-potential iron-sulfur protein [Arenimonas sp.]|uniref:high-potential iron-sulfur protein n=1 Tax=Arenimonas sp. TaxID=1872635 RepID=UPI0025C16507|nr:high-potential iron-sulfur protein [Arenimonas sp.]MBW8368015.1 high-potential iron-sulfur protein [Arenimonas sp.]
MTSQTPSRRRFLIQAVVATAALPFVASGLIGTVQAQALKPLPVDNAQAVALKYILDATKTKEPIFKPGSNCGNCQFFTAATGACTLFPGFSVPAAAWCSAWAKKA